MRRYLTVRFRTDILPSAGRPATGGARNHCAVRLRGRQCLADDPGLTLSLRYCLIAFAVVALGCSAEPTSSSAGASAFGAIGGTDASLHADAQLDAVGSSDDGGSADDIGPDSVDQEIVTTAPKPKTCDDPENKPKCDSQRAHCVDGTEGKDATCECDDGLDGDPYVEGGCSKNINECDPSKSPVCGTGTLCVDLDPIKDNAKYTCQCNTGAGFEITVSPTECACDENKHKKKTPSGTQCICDDVGGYISDSKGNCVQSDLCKGITCGPNMVCSIGSDSKPTCGCVSEYYVKEGDACVDKKECAVDNGGCGPAGFYKCTEVEGGKPTCEDVDECAVNNGGCGDPSKFTCKNQIGAAAKCVDINECEAKTATCSENADCENTEGDYECTCKPGFKGDGKSCTDINECVEGKDGKPACPAGSVCKNIVGGVECTCGEGFSGTPPSCQNIDQCAAGTAGCDPNAVCIEKPGVDSCECKPGFKGDGKICVDVKECDSNNGGCDPVAECDELEGAPPVCTCPLGMDGDGKTCYPLIVNIQFNGAVIAPKPAGKECWDVPFLGGCATLDAASLGKIAGSVKKIAELFGQTQIAALAWLAEQKIVADTLAKLVNSSQPPDSTGTVQLLPGNLIWTLNNGGAAEDTFTPKWSGVEWKSIKVSESVVMKLSLEDSDLTSNDGIGSVVVTMSDMLKVLIGGDCNGVCMIPTQMQDTGNILGVFISIQKAHYCGDGVCQWSEEKSKCAPDCGGAICNNGKCEAGETATNCPWDCKPFVCGDGKCDSNETCSSCSADCGTCTGSCSPLTSDGCSATQQCYPVSTGNPLCDNPGAKAKGATCSGAADCAKGLLCVGKICKLLCDVSGQNAQYGCSSGKCNEVNWGDGKPIGWNLGACFENTNCNLVTDVGCQADQSCDFLNDGKTCFATGSKTVGASCTNVDECLKGTMCVGNPSQCLQKCDTVTPSCPSGKSCVKVTIDNNGTTAPDNLGVCN